MNIRDDLKAYLDGELPLNRMEEIRKAVEADPELQAEVEFLEALSHAVSEEAVQLQPVGAEKALAAARAGKRGLFGGKALLLASAVGVLALVITYPLWMRAPEAARSADATPRYASYSNSEAAGADEAASPPLEADEAPLNGGTGAQEFSQRFGRRLPNTETKSVPMAQPLLQVADLELLVADASVAVDKAKQITREAGGTIEASSIRKEKAQTPVAMLTMRVPDEQFDSAVSKLQKIGTAVAVATDARDVTSVQSDITQRLKLLQAEEKTKLRSETARGMNPKLSEIRQEMELLQARYRSLSENTKLATITATFRESSKAPPRAKQTSWHKRAWAGASSSLSSVGQSAGRIGIYAIVFTPVWAPAAFGVWWLGRRR